jgi:outer membrane protein OmpA-like peptidoglycan-associated protein
MMLLVDGSYVKFYVNDRRIANIPNARLMKSNKIWIDTFFAEDPFFVYIGNIRVAASDKKIYDALAASGRLALQGIYFDTGSDKLRPESTGTLKEIGQMLKDHPELRLLIEGHTDNVGSEASNLTLSENRAAAVKTFLIASFGVDPSRLESKGFGASKPAAPNDTPEGRQTNRRVEIVKL